MKPLKPLEPMKPMQPMAPQEHWWPVSLGEAASSGSQNDIRYAFFPEQRRLLIEKNGTVTTYDSADHQISGVSQRHGPGHDVAFTSQHGTIDLSGLQEIG
jgi:hypothetical protein